MTADDRDSVNEAIETLGPYEALVDARLRLLSTPPSQTRKRRILALIIFEAAKRVDLNVKNARRLARAHRAGLKQKGLWKP